MAKTYTAAGSATAGQVYTASAHNVIVTDVNNLIVPPLCVLRKSTDQTGIGTGGASITWDTEDADTDSMHSTVSNTDRITIGTDGIYHINVIIGTNSLASTTRVNLEVKRSTGGGAAATYRYIAMLANGTVGNGFQVSFHASAVANDYFQCTISPSTGTMTVEAAYSVFSAVWVGRTS